MELGVMVAMIAALSSCMAVIIDRLRKSRCTKIESCCGCLKIERELDDGPDNPSKESNIEMK
tara:strand:+ start:259 stop:444 length:186 start_codon:yes stop_codon:yes gene_type:complete